MADCESSSVDSGRSFETHSIQSLQVEVTPHFQHGQQEYDDGVQKYDLPNSCLSLGSSNIPSGLKDDVTRLKLFELSLREQLKNLLRQRDNLVLELQQLHDAKPVLSKAYAVSIFGKRLEKAILVKLLKFFYSEQLIPLLFNESINLS